MLKDTLAWAREEAVRLHRIRWALILLTNSLPPSRLRVFDGPEQEEAARSAVSRKLLKAKINEMKTEIVRLREAHRVHASDDDLLDFLSSIRADAPNHPFDDIVFTTVSHLGAKFLNYYDFLPAHARIGIDLQGSRPENSRFEVRLAEATLFEDVCSLFNLAKRQSDALGGCWYPKEAFKQMQALFRATLSAVFYFVEAYVNGIAFDYLERSAGAIDEADLSLMMEWDIKRQRARFISTRDKLLQYPRIILGAKEPPLQESNCPEMKLILEKSKAIRDSIVHCSPFPDLASAASVAAGRRGAESALTKEELFYSLSMSQIEEIVDAAIRLVRKLNDVVASGRELTWLRDRGSEGFFPSEVFD